MKILNLIIKQVYFDQILSGKKTVEHREIRAKTANRYIEYIDDKGKVYPKDTDIPEGINFGVRPVKYDAIRFFVGYNKDRASALVEVKDAEIILLEDENGNEIEYEYNGQTYLAAEMDYHLGKIIAKSV